MGPEDTPFRQDAFPFRKCSQLHPHQYLHTWAVVQPPDWYSPRIFPRLVQEDPCSTRIGKRSCYPRSNLTEPNFHRSTSTTLVSNGRTAARSHLRLRNHSWLDTPLQVHMLVREKLRGRKHPLQLAEGDPNQEASPEPIACAKNVVRAAWSRQQT